MAKKRNLIGPNRSKLQPKLQVIANGTSEVNAVRAEQSAALRVRSAKLLRQVALRRGEGDLVATRRQLKRVPTRGKLRCICDDDSGGNICNGDEWYGSSPEPGE